MEVGGGGPFSAKIFLPACTGTLVEQAAAMLLEGNTTLLAVLAAA